MKRAFAFSAVVAAAGVIVLGAVFGPTLWAYYRFETKLDRRAAEYKSDIGPWPQPQDTCALCHGHGGHSHNAQYPSLADLDAAYIEAQLHAFEKGQRHSPQMGPLAAHLGDTRIKTLANYFARQTPKQNEPVDLDADLNQRGQALVAANHCAACHGEHLRGGPRAPRLAGQGEIYLTHQLAAFKSGERKDPTQAMNGIAGSLTDKEISAIAAYTAGLAPKPELRAK